MKNLEQIKNYFNNQIIFQNFENDCKDVNVNSFLSNTKDINYLKSYFKEKNFNIGLIFSNVSKNPFIFYKDEIFTFILNYKPVVIVVNKDIYLEILNKLGYDFINEINKYEIKFLAISDLEIDSFLKFFYDLDFNNLNIYGITGTNGKTSITTILYHLCDYLSNYNDLFKSSLVGTVKYCVGSEVLSKYDVDNSLLTTPDTSLIYYLLYLSNVNKIKNIFMEVSSHSLDQNRPAGLNFKISSFTNLTVDHLDYHRTMENYFNAKKKLFFEYKNDFIVVNSYYNDYGKILYNQLKESSKTNVFTYFIKDYQFEINKTNFILNIYKDDELIEINKKRDLDFSTNLIGFFNVNNLAIAFINFYIMNKEIFKVDYIDFFRDYINNINFLEGRLELVSKEPIVFVDYAHTPDALENVIKVLIEYKRSLNLGDLYVVFGAGGNRDKSKRPIMGNIVSLLADKVIITSDNPRDEDPLEIINDILKGVKNKDKVIVEPDREKAIIKALNNMKLNDILLIAGKGHENYQIIKNKRIFFSDKQVVKNYLNNIKLKK
ncbi:MAG: UDP-N-acetylmuramoyl-L-alanyl-D-glutamate--2,6-diaminopimelate ligase [bacterium]